MAALDTNVLVRFLVKDDAAQLAAAKKFIRERVNAKESLFVPVTVMLELEWVLRSNFQLGKSAVVGTLSQLLSSVELMFESEAALEIALALYARNSADYSDCLHVALAKSAGEEPLWTFDKAASRIEGTRLLVK